jgi:hypothetical protein
MAAVTVAVIIAAAANQKRNRFLWPTGLLTGRFLIS